MPFNLTIETVFLTAVSAGVVAIIGVIWLIILNKKMRRLLGGTNAKDIQSALVLIQKELKGLETFRAELEKYLETVEARLKRSVQSVETKRFNPFKGTGDGGNQSFSTAFIGEQGDGVVISSLYSRERVSVFSKPVKDFVSDFELTEEEREVISNAKRKLSS